MNENNRRPQVRIGKLKRKENQDDEKGNARELPPRVHGARREAHRNHAQRRNQVRHRKSEGHRGRDVRAHERARPSDR